MLWRAIFTISRFDCIAYFSLLSFAMLSFASLSVASLSFASLILYCQIFLTNHWKNFIELRQIMTNNNSNKAMLNKFEPQGSINYSNCIHTKNLCTTWHGAKTCLKENWLRNSCSEISKMLCENKLHLACKKFLHELTTNTRFFL